MALLIVLDTGVLSLLTNPKGGPEILRCAAWLNGHAARNAYIVVPEIADYELRRELLRAGKKHGLRNLDTFNARVNYEPLNTEAMRQAAQLWAFARRSGRATAAPDALDGDVIVCAQALQIAARPRYANDELVVATTNPKHLSPFVAAKEWQDVI